VSSLQLSGNRIGSSNGRLQPFFAMSLVTDDVPDHRERDNQEHADDGSAADPIDACHTPSSSVKPGGIFGGVRPSLPLQSWQGMPGAPQPQGVGMGLADPAASEAARASGHAEKNILSEIKRGHLTAAPMAG
jgi:hypothetical protein